jgi:hypothetical protein
MEQRRGNKMVYEWFTREQISAALALAADARLFLECENLENRNALSDAIDRFENALSTEGE